MSSHRLHGDLDDLVKDFEFREKRLKWYIKKKISDHNRKMYRIRQTINLNRRLMTDECFRRLCEALHDAEDTGA